MNTQKDTIVDGRHGKPIAIDSYFPEGQENHPIVVFAHGFKGFKDWGHWGLIAKAFARAGFIFIKFNFSHNGTTPEQTMDFADLEAFGNNNYTKELADIDGVLNWVEKQSWASPQIGLIGHSRGGGIGMIKAANDLRIKALATWASVSHLDYSWRGQPDLLEKWKTDGVRYNMNGRTKQNMPLYYQLFEDFEANSDLLTIEKALQKRPELDFLIVHGTEDPAVPFFAAKQLHGWHPDSTLYAVQNADHVFGGSHPYTDAQLSAHAEELVEVSLRFFAKALL